jgi:hypothetical protein
MECACTHVSGTVASALSHWDKLMRSGDFATPKQAECAPVNSVMCTHVSGTGSLTHSRTPGAVEVMTSSVAPSPSEFTPRPTVSGRPVSSWVFLAHYKPVPTHCNLPLQCCWHHHCCTCTTATTDCHTVQ